MVSVRDYQAEHLRDVKAILATVRRMADDGPIVQVFTREDALDLGFKRIPQTTAGDVTRLVFALRVRGFDLDATKVGVLAPKARVACCA